MVTFERQKIGSPDYIRAEERMETDRWAAEAAGSPVPTTPAQKSAWKQGGHEDEQF